MKYFVKVGDEEFEVELDGESATVGGKSIRVALDLVDGTPLAILRTGDRTDRVIARPGEAKGAFDISLGGYRFQVEAIDERTHTIRSMAGATLKRAGPAVLAAPMPGLVVRIRAEVGQQVKQGEGIVVMEAMKMENELRAPTTGTITSISVAVGSAVEKGARILEIGE